MTARYKYELKMDNGDTYTIEDEFAFTNLVLARLTQPGNERQTIGLDVCISTAHIVSVRRLFDE